MWRARDFLSEKLSIVLLLSTKSISLVAGIRKDFLAVHDFDACNVFLKLYL